MSVSSSSSSPSQWNVFLPLLERKASALRSAMANGLASTTSIDYLPASDETIHQGQDREVILLIDLDEIELQVNCLKAAFEKIYRPASSTANVPPIMHTFAVKSNPLLPFLRFLKELGMGAEAASIGELQQVLKVFDPEKVVFDSPTKSTPDLVFSLRSGALVNVDNMQELERVRKLIETGTVNGEKARVGLRINPQVGAGSMKGWSTAAQESKFGIALEQYHDVILSIFGERTSTRSRQWWESIVALHVHVGSQGCDFSLMTEGVKRLLNLAQEINERVGHRQISVIDIGGGLPVNFASDDVSPSFSQWVAEVKSKSFDGSDTPVASFNLITEIGRAISAKAGFVAARVEYVKQSGPDGYFALVHTGADLFVRTVYHPEKWPLRLSLLDSKGAIKAVELVGGHCLPMAKRWNVAGPCCFSLDIIAHGRCLFDPLTGTSMDIEAGDWLLLHDTGGYYHSAWSYYNSRQAPGVYGFRSVETTGFSFVELAPQRSLEQTLGFFS